MKKKKNPILEGMKQYFEAKQPGKDMKDVIKNHAVGTLGIGRQRWELENPTEKTAAELMSRRKV